MTQGKVFGTYEGFNLIGECTVADSVSVKKFRSSRTGLTVILAGVPGPLVYGTFVVGMFLSMYVIGKYINIINFYDDSSY